LETSAIIGELSDAIEDQVNDLLSDGVMTSGKVVGRVLFARNELLRMEELPVGARTNFIDNGGFEVDHDAPRHMFASSCFGKKRVEGIVSASDSLVRRHLTIRLNAMLQTKELPACVSDLNTSLANVDAQGLTHDCR